MVRQVLQVLKKVCKLCVNFLYSEKWLSLGTVELSSSVDQQPRSFTENDLISTEKIEYESEHQFLFLWESHLIWRMIPTFRINKQIQNPTLSGSIDIGCRYFPQHICVALFFCWEGEVLIVLGESPPLQNPAGKLSEITSTSNDLWALKKSLWRSLGFLKWSPPKKEQKGSSARTMIFF